MPNYPTRLEDWEGFQIEGLADPVVERGFIDHWLEAVRDGNPVYWDDRVAEEICGGIVAPQSMMFTFAIKSRWTPREPDAVWDAHGTEPPGTRTPVRWPNELHYALKEFTGLKEAIVSGSESEFHAPMRLGDRLRLTSRCYDIGPQRANRLGTGRPWSIENHYRNARGELIGIDRFRLFSYNRNEVSS